MKQNSHEATKPRRDKEELARIVVDCGFRLHKEPVPGLHEVINRTQDFTHSDLRINKV
jgi:hypothetical protein